MATAIEPDYYKAPNNLSANDVIEAFNLNFYRGNVIKYVLRAGKKDASKEIEDLLKARAYIDFEINRINNAKEIS